MFTISTQFTFYTFESGQYNSGVINKQSEANKMTEYKIEKYNVPLIWAQKISGRVNSKDGVIKIGEPIGPFFTCRETGQALNLKFPDHVSAYLNKEKSGENYLFYTFGEKEMIFKIPNVKYAKENGLLIQTTPTQKVTSEIIQHNMNICGFENVEILEFNKRKSVVKTKCCTVDCGGITEKPYYTFISKEQVPRCKHCSSIFISLIRTGNLSC